MSESIQHGQHYDLSGQVALVTGGGRGLGRAFAERLAALGCRVMVHGRREHGPSEYGEGTTLSETAKAIGERFGVEARSVLGHLQEADQAQRVVDETLHAFGQIDVLVHNAGGDIAAAGGKPDPNDVVNIKPEDVKAVIDSNLMSTIYVCQAVAKAMMQRQYGRIVTIGSVAGSIGRTNGSIYATSKAAAAHFTRCLADQMRPFDVTVNCLAPGDTRTARFLGTREVAPERLVEGGTLERVALVDEVARVVDVFAGPLGQFVTGQVIRVDGGAQLWPA